MALLVFGSFIRSLYRQILGVRCTRGLHSFDRWLRVVAQEIGCGLEIGIYEKCITDPSVAATELEFCNSYYQQPSTEAIIGGGGPKVHTGKGQVVEN